MTKEQPKILVVDDDERLRMLLDAQLAAEGFQVTTCDDGYEAGNLVHAAEPPFDLVIMDLHMPHVDGETAIGVIEQITANVPVIVVSGYPQDAENLDQMESVKEVLIKPVPGDVLVAKIRAVLAEQG